MMKLTVKRILCMLLCGAFAVPMCACNPKTVDFDNVEPQPEKVAANPYAAASLELTLKICEDYYDLENHVVKEQPTTDSNAGCIWPVACFTEALTETLALYPDNETLKKYLVDVLDYAVEAYRIEGSLTTPAGKFENIVYYNAVRNNHSDYYYDDNAWVCIQFLRAYELLGEQKYLVKAEELLEFFYTGIDEILGGGIYWDKSFSCKNTCADGPVAICFLEAYKITKNEKYLQTGRELVEWMNETLRENGLYSDNISVSGEINGWKADYNQGTPLYALCLLYEITGEKEWKALADETAEAALNNSFRIIMKEDAMKIAYKEGNPIYKSWCVGWLMRGFTEYVKMSGEKGLYFAAMENVLDRNMLDKKRDNGYYDPYFGSKGHASENETEVLQPSGVASVFAICGYYDVYIAPYLK